MGHSETERSSHTRLDKMQSQKRQEAKKQKRQEGIQSGLECTCGACSFICILNDFIKTFRYTSKSLMTFAFYQILPLLIVWVFLRLILRLYCLWNGVWSRDIQTKNNSKVI